MRFGCLATGRNGRSFAWSLPPGPVTAMLPANGRATSSLLARNVAVAAGGVKDRMFINCLTRRRDLPHQTGLPARASVGKGATGVYRARRRVKRPGPVYGLVLLGDPPSLDEDDPDPHRCAWPQRCNYRCRHLRRPRRVFRHGPAATCSAPMASRVSVTGTAGDASPAPATASIATTVSASIKDSCFVPSCPANYRKVSRSCRTAVFDDHAAGAYKPTSWHPFDSPPSPVNSNPWRNPCPYRCIYPTTPKCTTIPEAAPGRLQSQAATAAPAPDSNRLSGYPV